MNHNINNNQAEYVYLIREREFIEIKTPIYKIGRTKQLPKNRFNGYPKNSEILLVIPVSDSFVCEKNIYEYFKKQYVNRYWYRIF